MAVWALTDFQTRVHQLLGQSVTNEATSLVTSAMILDYFNECVYTLCTYGKIYPKSTNITTLSTGGLYAVSGLEAVALTTDAYCIGIAGIYSTDSSQYLINAKREDAGKLWQTSSTTTAADIIYWYEWAGNLYFLPSFAGTVVLRVDWYGLPAGKLASATSAPDYAITAVPFDDKYVTQLVNFAAYRGKQIYQQHQEAQTYLQMVSASINTDLSEVLSTQKVKDA